MGLSLFHSVTDSPRSRGWTHLLDRLDGERPGFPALAGMDPRRGPPPPPRAGIPRARGDGPAILVNGEPQYWDSPRSRGWTQAIIRDALSHRGFPALAGMDPPGGPRWPCSRRDSPRSRGWTRLERVGSPAVTGFPALAGMDPCRSGAPAARTRIPRARGDGPPTTLSAETSAADSPRSRGWTHDTARPAVSGAGFPALAGMDPRRWCDEGLGDRIPRARGDGPSGW